MADYESDVSEGSDIDVEYDLEFDDDVSVPDDPLIEEQWIQEMFADGSSDEEEFEGFHASWQRENFRPRHRHAFRRASGVKIDLDPDASPIQVFSLIFGDLIWNRLVKETNQYAESERQRVPPPPSSRWTPVTVEEVKTFIGLCIAMGVLRLPDKHDFWRQKKWLYETKFPKAMSRDRFFAIWRYLHLQDSEAEVDKTDKLWKVRWYLEYLTKQFRSLYEVDTSATVDESMVKYKGRLAFRQYLPLKPTKWGIKVWVLAESGTGYVSNFQVYTGREGPQEKGLGHRVVMDLTKPFYGSHLAVYMDNFYTSPDLMKDLKLHGVQACGTVRSNRKGLPQDLIPCRRGTKATMTKHSFKVAQQNELTFCVWQDTKPVCVLSNFHSPDEKGTVQRRNPEGLRTKVVVPSCLSDYQANMKGVDLLDQMVGYYQFNHRSKKWWRRLFFFFMTVSCYNAFVAAKSVGGESFKKKYRRNFKDWLEDLTLALVTPSTTRNAPQLAEIPRASLDHDLDKLYSKRKVCKECSLARNSADTKATATVYGCKQCDVAVHLECFGRHIRRHVLGQ